jgi:AcrR family transcriptional regulator
MVAIHADEPPRLGLRERKKAKTRALIQQIALRLFRDQGYAATSIEEIAEAAEVSTTTVFRYFPTKPDLVIYDDLDARLMEAVRAQPAEMNIVQVVRNACRSVFGGLTDHDMESQRERDQLMWREPELRAAALAELIRTLREVVQLVAERTGLPADDETVIAVAGAGIGVSLAAWFACEGDTSLARYFDLFDAAMAHLEFSFPLQARRPIEHMNVKVPTLELSSRSVETPIRTSRARSIRRQGQIADKACRSGGPIRFWPEPRATVSQVLQPTVHHGRLPDGAAGPGWHASGRRATALVSPVPSPVQGQRLGPRGWLDGPRPRWAVAAPTHMARADGLP